MKKFSVLFILCLSACNFPASSAPNPTPLPPQASPVQSTATPALPVITNPSEDVFCADSAVSVLVADFIAAITLRDGEGLAKVVSPVNGLTIQHNWWNPPVTIPIEEVPYVFASKQSYDFGVQDGSGFPLVGSFIEIVLPKLDDAFRVQPTLYCNDLENGSGPSTGYKNWPEALQTINYVAVYRTAPADMELDWRTWAIGIHYVDGVPYIGWIVQYHWEI